MAVRGGGGNLFLKKILVTYALKNTGKLVMNAGKGQGI